MSINVLIYQMVNEFQNKIDIHSKMLFVYILIASLFFCGNCDNIFHVRNLHISANTIQCVTGILKQYFTETEALTYINLDSDDDILEAIHGIGTISIVTKNLNVKNLFPHQGYFVIFEDPSNFGECFDRLTMEPTWNPLSRFLIVIKSLKHDDLKDIFDTLLKLHVINVLIVNGTNETHLYSYNPYDNYGCGKYYDKAISYGSCLESTQDLYPNKLVTGLRGCTFNVNIPHQPPFTIDPAKNINQEHHSLGVEQDLFNILAETEQFTVNYIFKFEDIYSTIGPDMKVSGPMKMLQNNETDVMFGSMILVKARAEAFTFLNGHLDYVDEFRFVIKKAPYVATWRYIYLEFHSTVWAMLLLVFITYAIIMMTLLREKDKGKVIFKLFDMFFAHGWKIRLPLKIRFIFIMWVWFCILVNNFYQSSLVSLITSPIREIQISEEKDIFNFKLRPCMPIKLQKYLATELQINGTKYFSNENKDCKDEIDNVNAVSRSPELFTISQKVILLYNKRKYMNKYGTFDIYVLKKPYASFLYATYFYKGFPITDRMRRTSIQLREFGFAGRSLRDRYYSQLVKIHYRQNVYKIKNFIQWYIYIAGGTLSFLVFILEVLLKH